MHRPIVYDARRRLSRPRHFPGERQRERRSQRLAVPQNHDQTRLSRGSCFGGQEDGVKVPFYRDRRVLLFIAAI